jgi:hypothetical protein
MARIQVSKDPSGHIIVSFPYGPLLIETAKTIPGHKWHPVEKYWSVPYRKKSATATINQAINALKEIYTHVSTRDISRIRSPLDNLDLKKGGKNESNR